MPKAELRRLRTRFPLPQNADDLLLGEFRPSRGPVVFSGRILASCGATIWGQSSNSRSRHGLHCTATVTAPTSSYISHSGQNRSSRAADHIEDLLHRVAEVNHFGGLLGPRSAQATRPQPNIAGNQLRQTYTTLKASVPPTPC